MRRAFSLALLGALLTVVAVGCGGNGGSSKATPTSSQSATTPTTATSPKATTKPAVVKQTSGALAIAYQSKMQQLGTGLSASLRSIGNLENSANGSAGASVKDVTALKHAQRILELTAGKLARIAPPKEIAADHKLLVKGVREYAVELKGVIKQLSAGVATNKALALIPSLQGVQDMGLASQAITSKGFDILSDPSLPADSKSGVSHLTYAQLFDSAVVHQTRVDVLSKWPKPPYQTFGDNFGDKCYEWYEKSVALYTLCFKNGVLALKTLG